MKKIVKIIGGIFGGGATAYLVGGSSSSSSNSMNETSLQTFSMNSDQMTSECSGGLTQSGQAFHSGITTTVGGTTIAGAVALVKLEPRSSDNVDKDLIEKKANEVYDKYNKSHLITVEGGSSLVAETPEEAQIIKDMFEGKTKEELIRILSVYEQALKEIQIEDEKVKVKKRG